MQTRKTISPLLYYIILSSFINLVFIAAGVIIFALFSIKFTNSAVIIVTFLLLWKGGVVAFVTWLFRKSQNKEFLAKFIGLYLGRFYGIIIGAFCGVGIANILKLETIIGTIVGALLFYFVGRWIGTKVSLAIGGQLDKVFSISEIQDQERIVNARSPKKLFLVIYIVVLPLLFVIIAWMMEYFDVPVGYLVELLPIARIIAIGLSIFAICYPWLMRKRWLVKFSSSTTSPELMIAWLGVSLSVVPSVYGLVLFVAMGASLLELCFFAMASSVVAIIWSVYNPLLSEVKAG